MDWHNFKVMFMYAIIVFVILLICGQPGIAFLALIGYSLYGLIDVVRSHKYKSKWDKRIIQTVNNNVKEIVICHITQRADKISKKTIRQFVEDINNGNYTVKTKTLTNIHSTPPTDGDSGYDYHLEFDNDGLLYNVDEYMANKCKIGDVLWQVLTDSHTANVMKSSSGYQNLFHYGITDAVRK